MTALRLAKWSTTPGLIGGGGTGGGNPACPRLIIKRKLSKLDNKDFVCDADGRL